MISCYTTLFNLTFFSFDVDEIMSNWLYYFDEIVIATDEKEESSVRELFKNYKHVVRIFSHKIDFSDQRWDGLLKNLALKNCSNEIAVQMDADERLSGSRIYLRQLAEFLKKKNEPCCLMIENMDLYYDLNHYMSIGAKWYIHTKKGCNRGVVNFAKIDETNFDPEKSDGCELVDDSGDLVECRGRVSGEELRVFHLGHLDFNKRVKLNQLFWRKVWSDRKSIAQKEKIEAEDVLISVSDMESRLKFEHNLLFPLWPTI